MKTEEGFLDVPGGKIWYRAVGDNEDAIPLLCLHGGPGFTHYYLEPLESLADRHGVRARTNREPARHECGAAWRALRFHVEVR